MKKSHLCLVCLLALGPVSFAYAEETPAAISLDQAVAKAVAANPEARAALKTWGVRRHEIGPAKAWPNPVLTFEDERFDSTGNGAPADVTEHYRVEQMVPFPGKLSTDARMKHHAALIAETEYRAKANEIAANVRVLYHRLFLTDQQIELAEKSVTTLKTVLQTAQSRLASGQSSTSDVFLAQMELRKMENLLFQRSQDRVIAQIELNTLLNQDTETAWGAAVQPALVDVPATLQELKAAARKTAPQYWAAMHERNHAEAMRRRSRLEFAPDFNLMYEREVQPHGPEGNQVGVGLSVPLWLTRPAGLAAGAREHVDEAEAMSENMANMVLKMVHMEFTETNTHLTLARNYESDILPTAQSNLRVAREQYASGRGDVLRVLESVRAWIEANNEYQEQLYHYGEHWSLLERWVGADLTKAKEIAHEQ